MKLYLRKYKISQQNILNLNFRARRRPGAAIMVREFEKKISEFYNTEIKLTTIAMDAWLCSNDREVDNVIFCLEPGNL